MAAGIRFTPIITSRPGNDMTISDLFRRFSYQKKTFPSPFPGDEKVFLHPPYRVREGAA